MVIDCIPFRVKALRAAIPRGLPIRWLNKELLSGPLFIYLRDDPDGPSSRGQLDYERGQAQAEFHVRIEMPELVELLQTVGVNPEITKPVFAVVRSEGAILADHRFNLSGSCQIEPHDLFDRAKARMLPGH